MIPFAKDVMERDVITVSPETGVEDAMALLIEKGISGMPVVDAQGNMVGIVTEKDMLTLLYGSLYEQPEAAKTVADLMTTGVKTVNEDDEITDVTECLIDNDFRRVPVLSDGKLVGLISRPDIMRVILELRTKTEQ